METDKDMPMVDHAILSLYDTIPEQNPISRMLIEDMVLEYDTSDFIGSAILSVVSLGVSTMPNMCTTVTHSRVFRIYGQ